MPLIATGRWPHGQPPPLAPRGRIPANATARERMARKTRTKKGRAAYARRKAIVEPVFGQMTILQGARYLLLRGDEAARAEWRLLSACHSLRKFLRRQGRCRSGTTGAGLTAGPGVASSCLLSTGTPFQGHRT